jgi:hypothetical protein
MRLRAGRVIGVHDGTNAHHGASLRAVKTFEETVALSRLRTVWRIIRALFWV